MCLYFFVYIFFILNSFVINSKSAYIYANKAMLWMHWMLVRKCLLAMLMKVILVLWIQVMLILILINVSELCPCTVYKIIFLKKKKIYNSLTLPLLVECPRIPCFVSQHGLMKFIGVMEGMPVKMLRIICLLFLRSIRCVSYLRRIIIT